MICAECGRQFEGRADGKYCSATCRQRAHRSRVTDVTDVTASDVTATGVTDVTASVTASVTATDEPGLFELDIPEPVEVELVENRACSTPRCRMTTNTPDGLCPFCRVGIPL
jgi:hypothetical protein